MRCPPPHAKHPVSKTIERRGELKNQIIVNDPQGSYLNVTEMTQEGESLIQAIQEELTYTVLPIMPNRINMTYKQFESIEDEIQEISDAEPRIKDRLLFTPYNAMEVNVVDAPEE